MAQQNKIVFGKISLNTGKSSSLESVSSTAVVSGFGKFCKEVSDKAIEDGIDHKKDLSDHQSTSSSERKAKQFDYERMLAESKMLATERNRDRLEKLELCNEDEAVSVPEGCSQATSNKEDDDDDDEFIGPPLPPQMMSAESADLEEEEEEDDDKLKLPIANELQLIHGSKAVSALAADPSGSRLVSGSVDYTVKYWDFQGMDSSREAFRCFRPADGYPVVNVEYSCTGDKVLVVSGSTQAKVYDRDGKEIYDCPRGDMYLHDMAKTKGHTSGLTDGAWHPKDKEEFLTSSRDGTCRIWNTSNTLQQSRLTKPRGQNGLKVKPTVCTYNRDGLLVACGCNDGSVQMWDHRKAFVNASIIVRNAHERGSEISSLTFSYDNKAFATKSSDSTLKLWDIRRYKKPVHCVDNLFSKFSRTDCVFSPNDKFIATGTSQERGEKSGKLKIFDRNTFDIIKELDVGAGHVAQVLWHTKLNQIVCGCGDGQVRILYDPDLSYKGAILLASKNKKRPKQTEVVVSQQVITPHALPLFREERHKSTRKLEEKDRKDPLKSHQPELPLGKTGSGGRVASGGSTLSSYIIRNLGIQNKVREEEDPREALLRHAKEASENPFWVTPAYAKTQPKVIFQEEKPPEETPTKKQKTS